MTAQIDDALSRMKVPALKDLCGMMGLTSPDGASRDDLILLIKAQRQVTPGANAPAAKVTQRGAALVGVQCLATSPTKVTTPKAPAVKESAPKLPTSITDLTNDSDDELPEAKGGLSVGAEDSLYAAIADFLKQDLKRVLTVRLTWADATIQATPALWFKMFQVHRIRQADILNAATRLEGKLLRSLRAIFASRWPRATPNQINEIIAAWKAAHDLFLVTELKANTTRSEDWFSNTAPGTNNKIQSEIDWHVFFSTHGDTIKGYSTEINALCDEEIKEKFGSTVVAQLKATRHARLTNLPLGDAEALERIIKKKAEKKTPSPDRKRSRLEVNTTNCRWCNAAVVGDYKEFYLRHNKVCPKKPKKK